MAEEIRSVTGRIAVDTNKTTYVLELRGLEWSDIPSEVAAFLEGHGITPNG